jgi:hypothetical protein
MESKGLTTPSLQKPLSQTKQEKKAQRLAAALRENLRKRKEQARLRKTLTPLKDVAAPD